MPVAAGTRLSQYEILAPIGKGGMGEVYRARDLTLKRDVALKLLPPAFAQNADRMARFQREAEVLASLNHPNIAHIFGVAESGEVRTLVMELAEGESPKGPMPFEDAWKIARQVAAALEYAHEHGVVHRDLKPANVKVTPDGVVKLLDFGLAKAFTAEREAPKEASPEISPTLTIGATQAGAILGTAAYMSPEQARGKNVDKRADIWAFGVMLYELLTGEHPFQGEDIGETLASVIKHAPDLNGVPAPARELIRSCLEKDPKSRLRDIGDAERLISGPMKDSVLQTRSKLWWIVAAAVLGSALVVGVGGGRLFHAAPPSDMQVLRLEVEPPDGGKFASHAMANGMALSPDGARLLYVASGKDEINRLWVRTLSEPSIRQLPGTEDARYPFWSPDGKSVAFFNPKELKRINLDGSGLQSLADMATGRGGVWLPDGRIVFGSYATGLQVVPASGGKAVPLIQLAQGEDSQLWPQSLPGGRLMYFVMASTNPEENAAHVISLTNPADRTRLMNVPESPVYVPGAGETDYLLWQRGTALVGQALDRGTLKLTGPVATLADPVNSGAGDGQIYATASKRGPLVYSGTPRLTQFTWYDRTGRALGKVGTPGAFHFGPFRISPDGRAIAAALDRPGGAQLVLLEIERGIFSAVAQPTNKLFPGWGFPAWGPDSLSLASGRGIIDLTSGSPLQVIEGNKWDWSPDGRELLYRSSVQGVRNEIVAQAMTQDRRVHGEPRVYAEGMSARFSPDGRWVAFSSTESAEDEVYIGAFPNPRRKIRISTAGGNYPVWSPDAREIYYVQPGNKLMAVSLKTTADSVQPSSPKELFVLPVAETPLSPFDVAKDGRFLVRADVPQASRSLSVIINWRALIK